MKLFLPLVFQILSSFYFMFWSRRHEIKQDQKLYIRLMIGGFIWSQLQTEYLIWRINKKIEQDCNK
jgi:hypothetical protein